MIIITIREEEGREREEDGVKEEEERKNKKKRRRGGWERGVTRSYKELQGVTRKKRTATDLLVLTRLFGT